MMRIWGLVRSQCLPVFMRSAENMDVLATLFRLLTRLTLNPNEPDDVLLGKFKIHFQYFSFLISYILQCTDECCLLPSQVLIPQLQCFSSQYSVASPILFYMINLPFKVIQCNDASVAASIFNKFQFFFSIQFEYNVEPQNTKFTQDITMAENGLSGEHISDSIRHIQLGKRPGKLRRCTRCGAYTSLHSVARTAAMRAWEQRWASGCRCGGFWRLHA